jgi:hypothetical protein
MSAKATRFRRIRLVDSDRLLHLIHPAIHRTGWSSSEITFDDETTMRRVIPTILAATGLLIALDAVGALAERPLGFPYPPLSVVSFLVYLSVGVLGAWRGTFVTGVAAAALVGFLDATVGPLLAWLIGPGPLGQTIAESGIFAYSVTVTTVIAAAAGSIGAAAGSWLERRRGIRGVVSR